MQTFIVKLVCFCLFGFIFYSAYLTNGNTLSSVADSNYFKSRTILVANKLETKSFMVQMQDHTPLKGEVNYFR